MPPVAERYLQRLASLNTAEWQALAKRAIRPRPGIIGLVDRLRSTGDYFHIMRGGQVPAIVTAHAMSRFKTIIASTQPRPSAGACVVAQNGLLALLFSRADSDEFFRRTYAGVSTVIPLDSIL